MKEGGVGEEENDRLLFYSPVCRKIAGKAPIIKRGFSAIRRELFN